MSKGDWPIPKSTPPGVDRQQVTFLVLPRKVTQRRRPRFAASAGYPALLDWPSGCGTRTIRYAFTCSNITSDLAGVVCQLSRMASCFISPRRNPLTSLRSAAHRGIKPKPINPYGGQHVAHHAAVDRQYNSTPVHFIAMGFKLDDSEEAFRYCAQMQKYQAAMQTVYADGAVSEI